MDEIWILGATGRTGRAIAARLAPRHRLVLVGRDPTRLRRLADTLGTAPGSGSGSGSAARRVVVAGSVEATVAELSRVRPAVVVNLIGPYTETALPVVRACPPGTHYVDLANELPAVADLLARHDEAVTEGRTLVTGAGFGVLATESVVLRLCAGRPAPVRVRVDAVAAVGSEGGMIGEALAGSVLEALAGGGRRYEHGRLVRTRLGGGVERVRLPDGTTIRTVAAPFGELEAARRASGAPFVVAASGLLPAGAVARLAMPVARALVSPPALRRVARRRLALVRTPASAPPRPYSWAHARVEDADGARDGWLRAGEAMDFTAAVAAEVTGRLARGEGRPGAYTPGALFGAELAVAAGGEFLTGMATPMSAMDK